MEGKTRVNISQRRHETRGVHWVMLGGWPKAQAPPRCQGGVMVPRFCWMELSLKLVDLAQNLDTRLPATRQVMQDSLQYPEPPYNNWPL